MSYRLKTRLQSETFELYLSFHFPAFPKKSNRSFKPLRSESMCPTLTRQVKTIRPFLFFSRYILGPLAEMKRSRNPDHMCYQRRRWEKRQSKATEGWLDLRTRSSAVILVHDFTVKSVVVIFFRLSQRKIKSFISLLHESRFSGRENKVQRPQRKLRISKFNSG